MRKLVIILRIPLTWQVTSFKLLSRFSLSFDSLIKMYLGKKKCILVWVTEFILLGAVEFLWCLFSCLQIWKDFYYYFFTYSLSSSSSSFLTPIMYMLICSTVYYKSFRLSLLTFLQSFSFCSWHLIISIVLSSNSVILSLFNSTLNPFGWILNFCYCTFQLQKSFSLIFIFFIHCFCSFLYISWL